MQTYDLIMLIVLVGTTLFGFVKGMAWQVAYLASLIVSYFVAVNFSPAIAPMFGDTEPFNRFAAMLALYVASSLGVWVMFRGVAGAIDRVKLNEFDRQMGALIGFARGVLWCIAITFFAATLLESYRPAILNSRAGHYIGVILAKSDAVVPPEVQKVIGPYVDRIEQGLDPNQPAGSGLNDLGGWPGSDQSGQGGGWPTGGNTTSTQQPAPQSNPPGNNGGSTWPQGGGTWPQGGTQNGGNTWGSSSSNTWPGN
ncbi:CvpA family protein [Aeoliella mucimassa]|uniref:Colicin V production protein n=1 Tax=Aeoliella mucimassa TaxID=2527972 RepID=A0A518AMB4_9BACT|nr:CvpA family protein [Aeoliella mucimassa]QDU55863.1 Colicin V production protein [Aeoliella mucimassa]